MNALRFASPIALFLAPLLATPAAARAQDARPELQRAIALEEQEHDLGAAESLYRKLLANGALGDAERAEVRMRLGRVLQRLGKTDEAKALLEEAAKAGGEIAAAAQRALQQQGPDAEREKELRAQARKLVEKALTTDQGVDANPFAYPLPGISHEVANDLTWLDKSAVPEVLDALRAAAALAEKEPELRVFAWMGLAALLWRDGRPEAAEFLRKTATHPSLEFRRRIASTAYFAQHDHMIEVAMTYLRDPDPEAVVQGSLLFPAGGNQTSLTQSFLPRLPMRDVVRAAATGTDAAKVVVLQFFTLGFLARVRSEKRDDSWFGELLQLARSALASTNPAVGQAAQQLLGNARTMQWLEGLEALLDYLPRSSPGLRLDTYSRALDPSEAARVLPRVVDTARALGPADASPTPQQTWLGQLATRVVEPLGPEAVPPVLELLRLGYEAATNRGMGRMLYGRTKAEHAAALLAVADRTDPTNVFLALHDLDLAVEQFAALRRLADQSAAAGTLRRAHAAGVLASTGAPEAADWIAASWDGVADPQEAKALCRALVKLAKRGRDERVVAAMRDAMAKTAAERANTEQDAGAAAQLVRSLVNDAEVERLRSELLLALLQAGDVASLDFLCVPRMTLAPLFYLTAQAPQPPHPFAEEQVLGALRGVTARQRDFFWSLNPWPQQEGVRAMSSRCLVWIAENGFDAVLQSAPEHQQQNAGVWFTLAIGRVRAGEGEGEDAAALRRWLEQQLAHRDPRVRVLVLRALDLGLARSLRASVEARLLDDDPSVAIHAANALFPDAIAPDAEWVQRLLQSRHAVVRSFAIWGVAEKLGANVERLVLPALRDADASVRDAAAKFAADTVSKDAVPDLVALLRDPSEAVRKNAADALQRIRFFHEQQAHWERIARGLDASAANANEKLLLQAKPGEPKDKRLLALRSLGALGAPEALPFLIDWTKDADAELARAAADAITQIHQRSGVPPVK